MNNSRGPNAKFLMGYDEKYQGGSQAPKSNIPCQTNISTKGHMLVVATKDAK
jgi:hypothetical protein